MITGNDYKSLAIIFLHNAHNKLLNVIMNKNRIEIGKFEEDRACYKYPYFVSINMGNEEAPIEVAEGIGYHSNGANLSPEEIVSNQWKEHFEKCGCGKVITIVKALIASGKTVTPQIIKEQWFEG